MTTSLSIQNRVRLALLGLVTSAALISGCAPLVVGTAVVGGTLVMIDRRTTGAQVDDQAIEFKAVNRASEVAGDRAHVNVTSYNRTVLITGEAVSEGDRTAIEQAIQRVENVRSTVNELGVMALSSLGSRSNDAILTSKVKATYVDARDLQTNAFKVVTERSVVYLMGRVTEREAARATELARSVSGVQKVVRVFEIVTEAELADSAPK
jgi:osmotically-inducible protein OsmY